MVDSKIKMSTQTWNLNREKPSALACAIAKDIFSVGDEPNDNVQRIEFIGGDWPDNETRLGGLCEQALARRIDASLKTAGVLQQPTEAT